MRLFIEKNCEKQRYIGWCAKSHNTSKSFERGEISSLYRKILKLSKSTVFNIIARFKKTNCAENKQRSGRPRIFNELEERWILRRVRINPRTSAVKMTCNVKVGSENQQILKLSEMFQQNTRVPTPGRLSAGWDVWVYRPLHGLKRCVCCAPPDCSKSRPASMVAMTLGLQPSGFGFESRVRLGCNFFGKEVGLSPEMDSRLERKSSAPHLVICWVHRL
ncbi:HTH_Tnp_Tc3_2 domain-containing protein [Trichonephila clavipes]|nr:HTH_Tnp_Tc3_2 domain-containing protein [Trichonephila clavipes]